MSNSEKLVAIIDYGIGNLYSVKKACEKVGINAIITSDKNELKKADAIILPGVGAFGVAMGNLKKNDLIDVIHDFAQKGKYIMGVCLGMQLLMSESEEFGVQQGIGLIPGKCIKFDATIVEKIPQIMWNKIYCKDKNSEFPENTPLSKFSNNEFMYFVHSFYVLPTNAENILSLTKYNNFEYCSSVVKNNIFGFQFHPEKSGQHGLNIYQNFKSLINES